MPKPTSLTPVPDIIRDKERASSAFAKLNKVIQRSAEEALFPGLEKISSDPGNALIEGADEKLYVESTGVPVDFLAIYNLSKN